MSQLSISDLNAATRAEFVSALANVFEHSAWIAEKAADQRPFAGVNALFAEMTSVVENAASQSRLALINAHPDLANRTQRAAGLTADSHAEQDSAGLDRLSDAEFAAFQRANDEYRAKFGMP